MRLNILPLVAVLMVLASAPDARAADCASPAKPEGTLLCNSANHVLQYCDGTSWIGMGASPDTGPVGGRSDLQIPSDAR